MMNLSRSKNINLSIDMLYNEYNDKNQYAINIMSIAIVFLEIFTIFNYEKGDNY